MEKVLLLKLTRLSLEKREYIDTFVLLSKKFCVIKSPDMRFIYKNMNVIFYGQ